MAFAFPKLCERVMVLLLIITPFLIMTVPRLMAWWPAVLGLCALLSADKEKPVLWIAACVPLWAATLALISTIWAAYPFETLHHALDRTPFYFGLSLAVIGLSRVPHAVWNSVLLPMAVVVSVGSVVVAIDQLLGHPIVHLYNRLNGEPGKLVRAAVNNRVLTGVVMVLIPVLWTLWHHEHKRLTGVLLAVVLGTLMISEASAALLALLSAIIVFAVASWRPVWVQKVMSITGVLIIALMPVIAYFIFEYRPDWGYLNSPSNGGRLEIWSVLSHLIHDRPWLGYGYEVTRYLAMPEGMIFFKEPSVLHPHNAAMQIWLEFGAVGMLCALSGWIFLMRGVRSALSLALMTLVCVISLLSFGLWQGTWLGLVVFATFYWKAAATAFGTNIK